MPDDATTTSALDTPALDAATTDSDALATPATGSDAQSVPVQTGALGWTAGLLYEMGLLPLGSLGSTPVKIAPGTPPAAPQLDLGFTRVTLLRDGTAFFGAVSAELTRVEAATSGYVHLAYWEAVHWTRLTDPYDATTPDEILEDRLRDVASVAGHFVKVILWDPQVPASWFAHNHDTAVNFQTTLGSDASGRISVQLEPYGETYMSQHQKLAIFSADGEVHAIVGGLNVSDWYWDDDTHAGARVVGYHSTVHDSAILLNGQATEAVESEFMRRWTSIGMPAPQLAPTAATAIPDGSYVSIAVTDGVRAQRTIRDSLISTIASAETYIYLENYAIFDSMLVNALAKRLVERPNLTVLLNIPHPNPTLFGPPNGYLHRLVWLHLALQVCTSARVLVGAASKDLVRADALAWDIQQPFGIGSKEHMDLDPWLEQSFLRSVTSTMTDVVPFKDILSVNGPFRMYTPVRADSASTWKPVYIHSKLGLVDDETTIVGSANFNYRSMLYDGEMSAFVVGAGDSTVMRDALFAEFRMPEASGWRAQADANLAEFTSGSAAIGALYILPLDLADFPSAVPDLTGALAGQAEQNLGPVADWLPEGAEDLISAGIAVVGTSLTGLNSRTFH